VNEEAFEVQDDPGASVQVPPHVEATLLSVWRRVIEEGGGPELTLAEAAALLGSSVDSVRRRIRAGQIRAYKDGKGRIRVSASVTYSPEPLPEDITPSAETVARLWQELKEAREQLVQARNVNRALREELDATEAALDYTKGEVSNLWRVITSRNGTDEDVHGGPASRLTAERQRIQGKISNMRTIAKRRRFPWLLAG
jgi:excisionase family DNA binding protein